MSRFAKATTAAIAVTSTRSHEPLDPEFGLSRTLEQVGDWRRSAEYLESIAESAADPGTSFWLNLRLADVYIGANRTSQAGSKLEEAYGDVAALDVGLSGRSIVDMLKAKAALANDRDEAASHLLNRALPKVRALESTGNSRRLSESLVDGLLVRVELAHGTGALEDALARAEEAQELCRRSSFVSPVLATRSRMMAALSRVFLWREPIGAECELLECYRAASASGFVYDAATLSVHLSGLYRISGRPREALDIIAHTLHTARTLGPSYALASLFIERAYASFALKDLLTASLALEEAAAAARDSDGLTAVAELLGSQIRLAKGCYQEALLLAECAEQRFSRMSRTRFVGQALTVQAKALYAIGHRRQALHVIRVAVELLSSVGQPLVLAEAQKMLADPRRLNPAR